MNFLSPLRPQSAAGPLHRAVPLRPSRRRRPSACAAASPSIATICEGCLLCEKLCPSGAIQFTRTPDGMTFDCWHSTCVFCGTCEFYCPTKAIHQTNDWHLAHVQAEKLRSAEHGLIPNLVCADCGGKGLDTAPNVAKVTPSALGGGARAIARALPEMPQQVPQEQGEVTMTRLPEASRRKLGAAAPSGIDYSSTATPQGVVYRVVRPREQRGTAARRRSRCCALGARPVDGVRAAAAGPRRRGRGGGRRRRGGRGSGRQARKGAPKTFGGTPLDGTSYEIDYHFDLRGDSLTMIAYVPPAARSPRSPPISAPADWPEREIMEMYAIAIPDHPDPRRLFLDPAIDTAVLERLIPYSVLVNASSTKALWDKVLSIKGSAS